MLRSPPFVPSDWSIGGVRKPLHLRSSKESTPSPAQPPVSSHPDPTLDPGIPTPGKALPNSGFNANFQPLVNATAFVTSFSVEGVTAFNNDGTGTFKGTSVSITERPTPGPTGYPSFPASASSNTFEGSFTYVVNSDDSFDTQMVGPLTGTVLSGPRTGQTTSVDRPPMTGLISKDGNTLTLASVVPTAETVTFSNGDVWPRICHRSRVLIKMDKD